MMVLERIKLKDYSHLSQKTKKNYNLFQSITNLNYIKCFSRTQRPKVVHTHPTHSKVITLIIEPK